MSAPNEIDEKTETAVDNPSGLIVSDDGVSHVYFTDSSLSPAKIGGKAAGLHKLTELSLRVPNYVVFSVAKTPVEVCFPLDIEPESFLLTRDVSVRSGAPVSMPGMMKTILPVSGLPAIRAAVVEVYESWNSPESVAYREANDIPDTGTAVIVQLIPRNIVMSGVAFTSDPNTSSPSFNPAIEIVEGTGVKLVNGEATGTRVENTDLRFKHLLKHLLQIHQNFGPSDVEWCATFAPQKSNYSGVSIDGLTIWFLQHRALKLAKPSVKIDVPAEAEKLFDAVSIGAASSMVLSDIDKSCYLKSFSPEMYRSMLKSKAIFTNTGSSTCHAAIIARELGLPALLVSDDDYYKLKTALLKCRKKALVSGATGEIFVLPKDFVVPEVVKTATSRTLRDPLVEKYNGSYIYVVSLMLDFYHRWEAGDKNGRIAEYAELMSAYLWLTCIAELRHMKSYMSREDGIRYRKLIRTLNKLAPNAAPTAEGKLSRDAYLSKFPMDLSQSAKTHLISVVYGFFKNFSWSSSYGGKKWAYISEHLLLWMTGRINDSVFLDGVFNLKHNSCLVFNKRPNLTIGLQGGDDALIRVLNYKQKCGTPAFKEIELYCDAMPESECTEKLPVTAYWPYLLTRKEIDPDLAEAEVIPAPLDEEEEDEEDTPEVEEEFEGENPGEADYCSNCEKTGHFAIDCPDTEAEVEKENSEPEVALEGSYDNADEIMVLPSVFPDWKTAETGFAEMSKLLDHGGRNQ